LSLFAYLIGDTTDDIKRDLKPRQLAGIGAVEMAWSSIESFVDAALLAVLGIQARVDVDVITRVGAFDAKVALINPMGEVRLGISEEQCSDVFKAVGDALESARASPPLRSSYRRAVPNGRAGDLEELSEQVLKPGGPLARHKANGDQSLRERSRSRGDTDEPDYTEEPIHERQRCSNTGFDRVTEIKRYRIVRRMFGKIGRA